MGQHSMDNLEDIDNEALNKLGLSTLDEEILPTQACEGENHNHTVDKENTELSGPMRTFSEEDHQRCQQMIQIYGGTENMQKSHTTEHYQIPVEHKTIRTLEVEDESLSEEMLEIAHCITGAHEGNINEVRLIEEEFIS